MKLSEVARELPQKKIIGDTEISGLCTDSRLAVQGDLYLCFKGLHSDSHKFAKEAIGRGAVAVMTESELPLACPQLIVPEGREGIAMIAAAFYSHPERRLKMIGVTGTNGKTTVSYMLYNMLRAADKRVGVIGTLGAHYGEHIVSSPFTTPDPIFLFSLLNEMEREVDYVVMEVSAHALFFKKECPIVYEVGIFTNLTRDHLDFFADMDTYGEAKKSMFLRCRHSVLNSDDAFCDEIASSLQNVTRYGLENPADAFAIVESEALRGSEILLNLDDELCECRLYLTGRHNVYNALAAAEAARLLGVQTAQIGRGIESTRCVSGRLEWVASFSGADIFVDFAHTPDGLEKSLSALREHVTGKLIVLFGCGGNRDAGKRSLMGECAAKGADFCVITSDNPRFEDPCMIISEIERGYRLHSKAYVAIEDRTKAIEYAIKLLKRGDALLVAGKGAETYQEIMGIKYDFQDKGVIEEIIGKLS